MQGEPTRDRILDAARNLFDAEGEAGLSMRRIATVVGITPMAIYRHYADKDALKNALMLHGFAAWEARVGTIAVTDPLAWLAALGEAYLDFALTQPRRYEAAFLLTASQARQFPRDIEAGRSPALKSAIARIAEAKAAGRLGAAIARCMRGESSAAPSQRVGTPSRPKPAPPSKAMILAAPKGASAFS